MEFLLNMALDINDIKFYTKCISKIDILSEIPINAYIMLKNIKIIPLLLDIEFKFYKTKEKDEQKCVNLIKSALLNIYLNSFTYLEQSSEYSTYPGDEIDILFVWGDKIIFKLKTKNKKDEVLDFLNELLMEFFLEYNSILCLDRNVCMFRLHFVVLYIHY